MATIDRIRKLLSLANDEGASENEAEVARQLAESMMEAAGISEADLDDDGGLDPLTTVRPESSGPVPGAAWYGIAAMAVARVIGCRVYRDIYRVNKRRRSRLVWVGTDAQREAAIEMYRWVVSQIDRLAAGVKVTLKGHPRARAYMNAYRLGVANAIAEQARALRQEHERALHTQALVRRDTLKEAIERVLPEGLKKTTVMYSDSAGLAAGQHDGKTIRLQKDLGTGRQMRLNSGQ